MSDMWSKRILEWKDDQKGIAYLSVVFTWDLHLAYQRAIWYASLGYDVQAGGPAVKLKPEFLAPVATCNAMEIPGVLQRHNPWAARTTTGCPNRCPFCAVPIIEGDFQELDTWRPGPVLCDNNLTAASRKHFDRVIDRLKPFDTYRRKIERINRRRKRQKRPPVWEIPQIDFNQGLDARRLTKHHARRLAELDCMTRLAWDRIEGEHDFFKAYGMLRAEGIPPERIHVYVLIGYHDTPEEAQYRLEAVANTGSWPNPMRFQPLDALIKNSYVGRYWTALELRQHMKYYSRLLWFRERYKMTFEQFLEHDGKGDSWAGDTIGMERLDVPFVDGRSAG